MFLQTSIVFLVILASCGTRSQEEPFEWDGMEEVVRSPMEIARALRDQERADDSESEDEEVVETAASPFAGEVISFAAHQDFFIRHSIRPFADLFSAVHPGSAVEIVRVQGDREETMDRMRVQLMAGSAPTIMQASLFGFPTMPNFDYFADWVPLMEAHPGFIEDEWHMNILNAFRLNDRLVGFPVAAVNNYVLANRNVPGIVEAFEGRTSISFQELIDLYHHHYEASGGMFFSEGPLLYYFRNFLLHRFFDYESRSVLFESQEFIDTITELYDIVSGSWLGYDNAIAYDKLMSESSMFLTSSGTTGTFYFTNNNAEMNFVLPLPITNESVGNLAGGYWGNTWSHMASECRIDTNSTSYGYGVYTADGRRV